MYSLLIYLYVAAVRIAAAFSEKARLMLEGQQKTPQILGGQIEPGEQYIWIHAASLGEFEQGRPLIEKIKSTRAGHKVLLTFFSPSGYEVRKNFPLADMVCYLPFDTPRRVRQFLDLAHPSAAVFIKYEFWQNYLFELRRRAVPTYIVSAIFRPTQAFFHWYGVRYRRVLRCYTHIFVQDEASSALLARYGISGNVSVTGDTRYDRVWEIRQEEKHIPEIEMFVRPVEGLRFHTLVAGSSWEPDEETIIRYFNEQTKLKLVIAPHETGEKRIAYIESLLHRPAVRLSETGGRNLADYDCLIIDSIGSLSTAYRYADFAYIGGGFGAGIHNTLEAAVYGIPVIFGPKYRKFKEACDLIATGGGFSINNTDDFETIMDKLLSDMAFRKDAGAKAEALVRRNIGASEEIIGKILPAGHE